MVQKVRYIMGLNFSESAELAAYQLQDVAHTWLKQWKRDRGADTGPIKWEEFAITFLDRFFLLELREAKVLDFINLRQGDISVKEYSHNFTQLARYAPHVVVDSRYRISKFVFRVSDSVVIQYSTVMLIKDMDISRLMVYAQQIKEQQNKQEEEREKERAITDNFKFTQPKSEGGNRP